MDKMLNLLWKFFMSYMSNSASQVGKEYAGNVGEPGSTPELGRSPEEGNGNPLQYSCLENSMEEATVHGISKS